VSKTTVPSSRPAIHFSSECQKGRTKPRRRRALERNDVGLGTAPSGTLCAAEDNPRVRAAAGAE
jgi:hypothetical protein